jgi:hypothetical protein
VPVLLLWLSLVFPSIYVIEQQAGWTAVVAHAAVAAVAIFVIPSAVRRLPAGAIAAASLATFAAIVVVFALAYPTVNVQERGRGSDDDDAHNVGARAMLDGRSPYDETTYLGNELHQMPGSFVLAAPFVLAGTSALQNLFWLPLFFVVVARETGDRRAALAFAWLVIVASPIALYHVATGTSHSANTISVLVGLWWLTRTRHRAVAAVVWGLTLASRANFLFLVPLAFGWIARRHGWREAVRITGLSVLVVAGLTLPFYVQDPAGFGPLAAADRLPRLDGIVPRADLLLLVAMGALSAWLAARPMTNTTLFAGAAAVQALPVAAGMVSASMATGQFNAWYAPYGVFASWFAWMALRGLLTGTRRLH